MAATLKFTFDVIGASRDEVGDKLDQLVQSVITTERGEPWIVIVDKIEKQIIDQKAIALNDPNGWIYYGSRTVAFAGPTQYGQGQTFHDGFRPQQDEPAGPLY